MEELSDAGHRRPRKPRAAVAVLLVAVIALVGAVVWERGSGTASKREVSVAAIPDPGPITIVSVAANGSTFFLKNVQGLTMTAKGPGTDLKFSRGLTNDTLFTDWMQQLRDSGKAAARRNLVVSLLDSSLQPVRRFNVTNAVPVSLVVGPIDGTSTVLETLTLSYDGIQPS